MSLLFLHKVTGVRKNKPYIPSWRSGPYAILLALHKESQKPNYPGNNHVCTGEQILKSFIINYLYQQLHICAFMLQIINNKNVHYAPMDNRGSTSKTIQHL